MSIKPALCILNLFKLYTYPNLKRKTKDIVFEVPHKDSKDNKHRYCDFRVCKVELIQSYPYCMRAMNITRFTFRF